jgi:hypothetical protein
MPDAAHLLVALVTDAINYVATLQNGQSGPITVTVADQKGHAATVIIGPSVTPRAVDHPRAARHLSDLEKAILEAVRHSRDPLRGKQIAAKAGKRYTSTFRESLSRLCRHRILLRGAAGYVLSAPLPLYAHAAE